MGAMRKAILMLLLAVLSGSATAESAKDALFAKVVAGAECKQTVNNGLICEYRVGQKLRFSIKDAGGSDPVISFRHSDWDDDFYAVMYFGCIVVVPGSASKEKYDGDGIYIAPKNGSVFRTSSECQAANK
jgi:hypothetical protein